MFGNPYGTGLNFTKVLSGISKTLNVANQVIPIYKEAKPMITNARTILGALKDIGKSNNKTTSSNNSNNVSIKKEEAPIKDISSSNAPRFFL